MEKEKELAKNTIILTVGKICTQFASFLLLPLYTALLQPEDYGIVDLFNTYILLIVPIFNWQLDNGLFRYLLDCRGDKEGQKRIFSSVVVVNCLQILGYLLVFALIQTFISSEYKFFLAIGVSLDILLNTFLQFSRGRGDNLSYSIASFLSAITTIVFNIVLIAGFKMGAYGMFIAVLCSKAITTVYLFISQRIWRYFSVSKFDFDTIKEIARYSFPLIPNQLAWWVVGVSDRTIVSHFIGVAANGIYSVANKFSSVFIAFYNIFNLSWTESVALHFNDDDGNEFLSGVINSMFCLFAAICFGIIAYMPFVFPVMINSQYDDAYAQIPILMIAVLFQVIVGLYSVIYVAVKKSAEVAATSLYAGLINIIVDLILIKFIGLYAASFSTLVAYAAMAIYRYFHVKKYMNIPLNFKALIVTLIVGCITLISYYYNHLITNLLTATIVSLYAVLLNKTFLLSIIKIVQTKLKNIKKEK